MAQIEHIYTRRDGSEVKIVATEMFGLGLHRSIDYYVHRRASSSHPWVLLNDRPHPDWRSMSVDQYVKNGRSEVFRALSHGEIFKVLSRLSSTSACVAT